MGAIRGTGNLAVGMGDVARVIIAARTLDSGVR